MQWKRGRESAPSSSASGSSRLARRLLFLFVLCSVIPGLAVELGANPLVLIVSVTVFPLLALRQIRRSLAPLSELERGVREIGKLKFNTRLEFADGEPFKPLAGALNKMAEDLGKSFRELRSARLTAEGASKTKTEFLANMSHEIRTPMTAILGYTDEIFQGGDLQRIPPDRLHALNSIRRNGNHLLRILNDILDLSKIEAGQLEPERLHFSPIEVAADACSLMRVAASEKGLDLSIEFQTAVPETIQADPTRVRQILYNLLGNAIKFSERGVIHLRMKLVGIDRPRLRFEITDPGEGMTPEVVSSIFEPFRQADGSTTRTHGGTGLGLSICKRLVDLMGGSIWVESTPGEGSTFRFELPTGPLEGVRMIEDLSDALRRLDSFHEERAEPAELPLVDCRILLAEDSPDNQRLIGRVLDRAGAAVEIVENGEEAVERALEAQAAGEPFDVVLMDMQMPVLDGYAATVRLRREGYGLPIIALTAHAMSDDRDRCLESGCDSFATKPIDREVLLSLIARFTDRKSSVSVM